MDMDRSKPYLYQNTNDFNPYDTEDYTYNVIISLLFSLDFDLKNLQLQIKKIAIPQRKNV